LGLRGRRAADTDLVVVIKEGLQRPPRSGFGHQFHRLFVKHVSVFDAANSGTYCLLHRSGGVRVRQDVGSPVSSGIDGGPDFAFRVLGDVEGIVGGDRPTAGHDFDLGGAEDNRHCPRTC
jgi:hypothetical protein